MQYFQAVQEGKKRANEAQMKLFDVAGFAMLTLTTKKKDGKFIQKLKNQELSNFPEIKLQFGQRHLIRFNQNSNNTILDCNCFKLI